MIEISGYNIKEAIGKGGMATVYCATHERLQREIALKVMAPESSATKVFQDSFLSEGRIIAKLEHPHIVKVYDIDTQNTHFYMSMELLHNGSLKRHLAKGKLSLETVLKITTQLADALSYAHKKGYIHRDIKPANIMFRKDNSTVLTDFGIAKLQGTLSEMTKIGYMSGTPHYMSPEHALGSHEIDHRSDIYSLGVVFYEMLTGMKPFTGESSIAVVYKHVNSPIPKLTGKHTVFQSVLNKALAKEPEQRFDNIQQFSKALYNASQLPTATSSENKVNKTNKANKQSLWIWLLILSTIALSSIVGYYYYSQFKEKAPLSPKTEKIPSPISQNPPLATEKQNTTNATQQEQLLAVEKQKIQIGKINNHLSLAKIQNEKRRIFNHSNWSKGCKHYLEDIDGPYNAKETSEWHYQQILLLDAKNQIAQQALEKINKKKLLEFTNCNNYQRPIAKDPLQDLFKN